MLPSCPTVITFDDGFYSFFRDGIPVLREYSFPATVYVTTYYAIKELPIFRLVVQYMFWKSGELRLDLDTLGGPWNGELDLRDQPAAVQAMWDIIRHAESHWTESQRVELARRLGRELRVDFDRIVATRMFSIVNRDEIRLMEKQGIDVQLHTHRHRFPADAFEGKNEVEENRHVLETILLHACDHFCYPSGVWCQDHWDILRACNVRSATTCDAGLNYRRTPVYALRRILETDRMTAIEFEAEMCGYAGLLRAVKCGLAKIVRLGDTFAAGKARKTGKQHVADSGHR